MTPKSDLTLVNLKSTTVQPLDQLYGPLSRTLQNHLSNSGKSIYQVSHDSGIDSAYIWRIVNDQKHEISREVLILLSLALVLEAERVDEVVEFANDLLDAAGYKVLRRQWKSSRDQAA